MKNCVIVMNTFQQDCHLLANEVLSFLKTKGVSAQIYNFSGQGAPKDEDLSNFKEIDLAITIGGDGTVLFAARICAELNIPIFAINLGHFAFIAGFLPTNWQENLIAYIQGDYKKTPRIMIKSNVVRDGKTVFSSNALNDAVISANGAARILQMDISCSGNEFGEFKSDGIILATPTGSTAYSASAGGPILDPLVDALVFSPICPFSLSNRPLVLSPESELSIKMLNSRGTTGVLTLDGQVSFILQENDIINIMKDESKIVFIGCDDKVFYKALKSKLNWSGGPNA